MGAWYLEAAKWKKGCSTGKRNVLLVAHKAKEIFKLSQRKFKVINHELGCMMKRKECGEGTIFSKHALLVRSRRRWQDNMCIWMCKTAHLSRYVLLLCSVLIQLIGTFENTPFLAPNVFIGSIAFLIAISESTYPSLKIWLTNCERSLPKPW